MIIMNETLLWRLPTFAGRTHYHRPWAISLPCSEWKRVAQAQYNRHKNVQLAKDKLPILNAVINY